MLTIPVPLVELGVAQDLRVLQLKIAAALPGSRTSDERFVRQRFHLDAVDWEHGAGGLPHLQAVHQAVWRDCKLQIRFRVGPLAVTVEQEVDAIRSGRQSGILVSGLQTARRPASHSPRGPGQCCDP